MEVRCIWPWARCTLKLMSCSNKSGGILKNRSIREKLKTYGMSDAVPRERDYTFEAVMRHSQHEFVNFFALIVVQRDGKSMGALLQPDKR